MRSKRLGEISGFENCNEYIIYENGQIYSELKNDFLKPCTDSKGYLYIDIRNKNARIKCPKVHKLVTLAFYGESNGLQINHIDGNKKNNNINNLEYVTNEENRKHAILNHLKNEVGYNIAQLDMNGNIINIFRTCDKALKYLEIENGNPGNIGRVINGKRKTAYGYNWKKVITVQRLSKD